MGCLGRVTSMKDLPADEIIIGFIKDAKRLNDEGIKLPLRPKSTSTKEWVVPDDMQKALNKNKTAKRFFDEFSPGKRKEYIQWITDAKTDATRLRRLTTSIEYISEGKALNWRYEKC